MKFVIMSSYKSTKFDARHLFSGGLAGVVSHTAINPLERLIILQQTGSTAYRNLGIWPSFKLMWR